MRLVSLVTGDKSLLVQRALVEWALQDRTFNDWYYDSSNLFTGPVSMIILNPERRGDLRRVVSEVPSLSRYALNSHAVKALGKLKVNGADLIEAMAGSYASSRREAAVALGEIGDQRAVRALLQAANDQSEYVRDAVRGALMKLGHPIVEEGKRRSWLFRRW